MVNKLRKIKFNIRYIKFILFVYVITKKIISNIFLNFFILLMINNNNIILFIYLNKNIFIF